MSTVKKMKCVWAVAFALWCAAGLFAQKQSAAQTKAPQWVTDKDKAYPEKEWLSVVTSNPSREQAQASALSSLAGIFKVDVQSMNTAMQSVSQTVSGGKTATTQNSAVKQQVDASTNVNGLMGVLTDVWADKSGEVYVCARMNRREGAATYSSIITQNDQTIQSLMADAGSKPATFGAYQSLNFAYSLATITDNYMNILSVVDSVVQQKIKLSYGNAANVRKLALDASNAIVITVKVTVTMPSDLASLQVLDAGRIAKPFQEVFTKRKFKTTVNNSAAAPYTLNVDFTLDTVDVQGNANKFTRYVIKASLTDQWGEDIMSFQDNKRSGHSSLNEAAQRSMRDAEAAITGTGFARAFDAYLASLL